MYPQNTGEYIEFYFREYESQDLIIGERIVEKGINYVNILVKSIQPFDGFTFSKPIKKKVIRKII